MTVAGSADIDVGAAEVMPAVGVVQPKRAIVAIRVRRGQGKNLRKAALGIDGGADGEDVFWAGQVVAVGTRELHDLAAGLVNGVPIPLGEAKPAAVVLEANATAKG